MIGFASAPSAAAGGASALAGIGAAISGSVNFSGGLF